MVTYVAYNHLNIDSLEAQQGRANSRQDKTTLSTTGHFGKQQILSNISPQ